MAVEHMLHTGHHTALTIFHVFTST